MKIAQVLENMGQLISLDVAILVLLIGLLLMIVAAFLFKQPFLLFLIFAVGIAAGSRFGALSAIGLAGRYLMIAGLTVFVLSDRRRFPMTIVGLAYLFCISLMALQAVRAPSYGDAAVRVGVYFLSFPAFVMLGYQLCQEDLQFRKAIHWLIAWAILIVWIQIPLMEYAGESSRAIGIFTSPAGLMNAMMYALVILAYALVSGICRGYLLLLVLPTVIAASGLLLVSGGRTSIVTVVFALPFVFRLRPGKALLVGTVACGAGVLVLSQLLPDIPAFQRIMPHLMSTDLSGREELWSVLWERTLEHPFLGHGLEQSWLGMVSEFGMQGHSTYLELAYDVGIPVVALIVILLSLCVLVMWHTVAKVPPGPTKQISALSGALMMSVLAPSLVSASLLSVGIEWSIFCLSLGMLVAARQRMRQLEDAGPEVQLDVSHASLYAPQAPGRIYGY